MYSNKENVNILTALLVEHGVRHAVVCPGSRNSPIVHNFNECPQIRCYPVTDERSAAATACSNMCHQWYSSPEFGSCSCRGILSACADDRNISRPASYVD